MSSVRNSDYQYPHPLDPATAKELTIASDVIKKAYGGDVLLHFKAAGLEEPPKALMVRYLEAEHAGLNSPLVPRCIFIMWYIKRTPRLFEAIVDVGTREIIHHKEMPRDFHGPVDRVELNEAAQAVLADGGVKKEIERLKLGDNTVVLDPWDYGVDGKETQERHTQVSVRSFMSASMLEGG
ncbi:MAG: hypothetical protein M1819_007333 [Sarea resinae]|nr:MAG: hypothetical protein M1819_007333 [Sarea resinae]